MTCLCVHVVVEELLLVELQRGRDGERAGPAAAVAIPSSVLMLLPQLVLLGREVLLHGA